MIGCMDQRVHFLTLATPDLDAARRFYRDGLGWEPVLDVPGEILFFQIAPGLTLGLFEASAFDADLATAGTAPAPAGLSLSHNVDGPAEVDEVVTQLLSAGGRLLQKPQRAAFGGYHGHVADPNGVIWEICHNPGWRVEDDGTVRLGPVDA